MLFRSNHGFFPLHKEASPWKQNASTSLAPLWPTFQPVLSNFGGIFDFDAKSERLRTVNASLEDPKVWDDPKKAQELGREKKLLDGVVVTLTRLTQELADNTELFEMSKAEGDDEGLATIEADTQSLVQTIEDFEFRRMFSQEADPCNAFLDIQAGAEIGRAHV